jgi:serine/threonine-protein kinase RsbW
VIGSQLLANGSHLRPDQDEVTVRLPALRRYVGSVRTLTTALAAQCDLTVDDIEDVQIAIDEACALLLQHAPRSQAWLDLQFLINDGRLVADVRMDVQSGAEIDRTGLSWMVLSSVTDTLDFDEGGRSLSVCFSKKRGVQAR